VGLGPTVFLGNFLRPEMLLAAESGVVLGLSTSMGGSSHPVKPPSPFVFSPLPAPELLPPVTLDVPPAPVRPIAGSRPYGAPAPLPSSSVGVGSGLTQPIFPFLSQGRLSWVRRFVLLSLCCRFPSLFRDTIGRLGDSRKFIQCSGMRCYYQIPW